MKFFSNEKRWHVPLVLIGLCGVIALGTAGCSQPPNQAIVQGSVKLGDKKVTGGTLFLHYKDSGKRVRLSINGNGDFYQPNVPLGTGVVTVDNRSLLKQPTPPARKGMTPEEQKEYDKKVGDMNKKSGVKNIKQVYMKLPLKYADPAKSDITFEIAAGTNTVPVVMKTK